jgi:hypothetical protein
LEVVNLDMDAVEVEVVEDEVSLAYLAIGWALLTRIDDGGRGRGGYRGGGGERSAPESTGVRFRKMVIKLGDEEVSCYEFA